MKLGQRIVLLVVTVVTLTSIANFMLTRHQVKSLYQLTEQILASAIGYSIREALSKDIGDENVRLIQQLLGRFRQNEDSLEYLYITKGEGHTVFAHTFAKGLPAYLSQQSHGHQQDVSAPPGRYQADNGVIYEYTQPLARDYFLHIGLNRTRLSDLLASNRRDELLLGLVVILAGVCVAYGWSRRVTQPLARFTRQVNNLGNTDALAPGNFEYGATEIHTLANAFQSVLNDRREAMEALAEREENLAITLNCIGDAVVATDSEGRVMRMNPVAEQLTGWTLEEARGKSINEIFPIVDASTRETIENPVEKVIATGETVYLSNHTTLIARDGSEYQIADSAAPIRNQHGEILGMVLVFNDVTEQYRLRQAVIVSERRYQTLASVSPVGIFYTDADGACLYVNERWCEITGLSKEQALGSGWADALHKDDVERVYEAWSLAAKQQQPFKLEYRFQQGDNVRWVLGQAQAEYDDEGKVVGYVGSITDITDRRQAEQTVRRAQKMDALGKLTGGIAHDYNNMLGVIIGYTDLLTTKLEAAGQGGLADYTQKIKRAAERGANLTRKLLAFSRRDISESKPLNINSVLQETRQMLEKTLTARIRLEMQLQPSLWPVWLDAGDLEDAIVNMCINAMHAIDSNGVITLTTENAIISEADNRLHKLPAGEYVTLSISDTGVGMDEETREKIFEPFFTTKQDMGTGLGLSQVYGFVTRSGGEIHVYSEPGHGSRFILYFPKLADASGDMPLLSHEDNSKTEGHETILVVDDEADLLDLVCEVLDEHGYHTLRASDANSALTLLEQHSVDAILCDVIMPEMDGYELASIVRQRYSNIRIQLASGFTDNRNASHSENQQYAILQKPYHIDELLKAVRRMLDD